MDFSAWNWASYFRLHEAACLIAGVMPVAKRYPTSEELPPQARPILIKLAGAYIEWYLQKKNPERLKSIVLDGVLNEDGSLPPFPAQAELTGEIVSRKAIHQFLTAMAERGLTSGYDFGSIGNTPAQSNAAAPAPVADDSPDAGNAWKKLAQEKALGIIARQAARGLFPNQQDIADEVARDFRSAGTVGADGKPLSGSTIKRHALKGISSATGRRLSTSNSRGK